MPLTIATDALTIYTLPADGDIARRDFLSLLHNPGEVFLADFGFTDAGLVAEIEQADAALVPGHAILDRVQSTGHTERVVLANMLPLLRHWDVTISTAGPDSRSPSQLMHNKVMIVRATDGGEAWCWLGSINFSSGGWLEANTAVRFRSDAYAAVFIAWFERTREWARVHIPQLMPVLPSGVSLVPAVAAVIAEGA
jgi:hypothetical protein